MRSYYGMKDKELNFKDEEIALLFGHEAAEDEKPSRLKEYYFKNEVYEQVSADLPLRIVVGHKGIGKSAILQIMQQEFNDANILTIKLTPDDISEIAEDDSDMLKLIRKWKEGLTSIVSQKAIERLFNEKIGIKKIGNTIIDIVMQYIKNKIQIKELDIDKVKNDLLCNFYNNKKMVIFIDDLDRGWEGKKSDIRRISAMLNAVRDLARDNERVNFKISLRTDAYYLYRTNDESTDKVEGSIVWMNWTNFDILALLAKRIVTYFGGKVDEKQLLNSRQEDLAIILNKVFSERFQGKGNWSNIPMYRLLTSLIRKRPRDLIKLCALAAKEAKKNNSQKIGTKEFNKVFETYSQGRLRDTIIEFKSELPEIEKLLINMKPSKKEKTSKEAYKFKTDQLLKKVNNIISSNSFSFTSNREVTAKDLCSFMYKINFLTARKDMPNGNIERKYFEENEFLMSGFADFGFDWEIHPAYRWALQPDDVISIMDTLVYYN